MKRFAAIEVEGYNQQGHRHERKLADLFCERDSRPDDLEVSRALRFYGLEAGYPLILDYSVHAIEEAEFTTMPKSCPFEIGATVFWRKEQPAATPPGRP